jgi:hypothetical protein
MATTFMRFSPKISVIGLGLLMWTPGWAQVEEVPPLQMDLAYVSSYVFRGIKRAGDSAQATVEFNRDGVRGGLWVNQPFDRGDTHEVDLNAAYAWRPADALTLEASLTQAWFHDVPGGDVERSFEAGLSAMLLPVQGFTPKLAYYHDFRLRADTTQASLARSIALTRLGAFLELNFFAGWASGDDWRPDAPGPRRTDSYGYWGGDVQLPYHRVGSHSTVIVGVHYADSFGRSLTNGAFGHDSRGNLWASLGVKLDF